MFSNSYRTGFPSVVTKRFVPIFPTSFSTVAKHHHEHRMFWHCSRDKILSVLWFSLGVKVQAGLTGLCPSAHSCILIAVLHSPVVLSSLGNKLQGNMTETGSSSAVSRLTAGCIPSGSIALNLFSVLNSATTPFLVAEFRTFQNS